MNTNIDRESLNFETAQIQWTALQRFFAAGSVIHVTDGMDLVEVACQFVADNKPVVQQWLTEKKVMVVADEQAREWLEQDATLWAVVVAPWVLVQARR